MPSDLLALLAGRRGHFRMESGYHSERWFNLDRLFVDPARLQPFVDDLGADSLDTVELVMALEEEFETEIPDEDAEKITTVAQAVSYIVEHQAKG